MFFFSSKPDKVADTLASKMAKELKIAKPPVEIVMEAQSETGALAGVFGRFSRTYLGGATKPLFTVEMKVAASQPFDFAAHVVELTGPVLGSIFYSMKLSKPVSGPIVLEEPKALSKSKFTGEDPLVAKLNANSALIKKINKFVRSKYRAAGDKTLSAPQFMKIEPDGDGAILAIGTLARNRWIRGDLLDPGTFLEIAAMIEACAK